MALSVNLLKKSRVLTEKQYQIERKVLIVGVVMFVTTLAALGAAFGWQMVVNMQVSKLDSQIAKMTEEYEGLKVASTQQLYIKSRLKLIQGFLAGRGEIREAMQRIFALSFPDVTISGASFEDRDLMNIQTTAGSIASLDAFYKYMEQDNGFFVKVVNKGLSRGAKGEFNMDLALTLPQGEVKK